MNWEAIGAIGDLIGGLAVVLSLIYVGIQIRQNTTLGRATAQRELYESYQHYLYQAAQHPELLRRGLRDFSSLSKDEQIVFNMHMSPFFNHLDQTIRMHRAGFETDESVQDNGDICMSILGTPGGRIWWEMNKAIQAREGRRYVEDRLRDPSTLPPPLHVVAPWWAADDA